MIDLSDITGSTGSPKMLDWGSTLQPVLGGVEQRLNRLGTRFSIDVETRPYRMEAEGRRHVALLQRAKQEGGFVPYPQLGMNIGGPGSPTVSGAHTGGTTLNITGATPYYVLRPGQALNIIRTSRRYLHFVATQVQLGATGNGAVVLTSPMRVHLAGGETVDLKTPGIEGFIDGDEMAWSIAASRLTTFSFIIRERA